MCDIYDLKIEVIKPGGDKDYIKVETLYANFVHRYKKELFNEQSKSWEYTQKWIDRMVKLSNIK